VDTADFDKCAPKMAFSQQAEACIAYCIHNRRKPKGEPIATATTADALKSRADIPRMLLLALSATLIYALVDTVLNRLAFSEGWMIFWPLNGVTIAVLLRRPLRDWAPILTGVAFGTGLGECFDGNSIVLELWLRCVSILEVFICAWLLPSFSDLQGWLSRRYLFLRFCAAIVLGPGISGLLAAAVFRHLQHQHFLAAFNSWATADALGIAALLPISLAVGSSELKALFKHSQVFKTVGVLIVMLAVTTLVFYVTRFPLLFLLYPTLLIVEAVLAFAGSAIALPLVCTVGVYFTMHGRGPFGLWPVDMPIPRGVALQVFLGFNLVALLPASILLMERRKMAIKLTETNERLSVLAAMDGLTGIANRRSLDERFADEWKRAIRVHSPLSLLMIDLDHFKDFNDLYGHDAGDRCLKTIAETLREHVRRPQDLAGRFGGEEFAILLPHTPLADAFELAERVRQSIFDMAIRHERSPHARVTVSIGCAATIPAAGADPKELLRVADAALYQAKKVGRNNVATP
jgi:diguanylate cyclase (GGDEF)-like protein